MSGVKITCKVPLSQQSEVQCSKILRWRILTVFTVRAHVIVSGSTDLELAYAEEVQWLIEEGASLLLPIILAMLKRITGVPEIRTPN